ncbi:hypothetical protein JTB14_016860 [Gonioctena quinquepunctata]|nr:hypothetical protein JTB14_016860 [Gonioctena quinquepunctata]
MNLKLAIIAENSGISPGNAGRGRYRVDRRISAVTSAGKWGTFQTTVAVAEKRKGGQNASYVIRKDIMQRYAWKGKLIEEMELHNRGFGRQGNGRYENGCQDFASTNRESGDDMNILGILEAQLRGMDQRHNPEE